MTYANTFPRTMFSTSEVKPAATQWTPIHQVVIADYYSEKNKKAGAKVNSRIVLLNEKRAAYDDNLAAAYADETKVVDTVAHRQNKLNLLIEEKQLRLDILTWIGGLSGDEQRAHDERSKAYQDALAKQMKALEDLGYNVAAMPQIWKTHPEVKATYMQSQQRSGKNDGIKTTTAEGLATVENMIANVRGAM